MKRSLSFALLIPLFLLCAKKSPNEPIAETTALIYEHGGERPAAGALVKFFEIGDTNLQPFDVCTTDEKGRYSVADLPAGKYDIWAEKDSFALFQSHVVISSGATVLYNDTLEPSSSLHGVVVVQYPRDPRTVTIRVRGSDKLYSVSDENGGFTLTGLAAGTWSLLIRSTLPGYLPFTKTITLRSGAQDTLDDTLRFFSADVPFVSGIRIYQDTLAGVIKLSWEKTAFRDCLDYVIYKASWSDVQFPDDPTYVTADTMLIDSIRTLDSSNTIDTFYTADSTDTLKQGFRYRIAIRTWEQGIGPTKGYVQSLFAPKSSVTTYFTHNVKYPVADTAAYAAASIHDTLVITLTARNPTRPLRSLSWYDPFKKDTVSRMTMPRTFAKELRDTIRYAFNSLDTVSFYRFVAVVADDAGDTWFDTVYATIVEDIPIANAGHDTGVFVGTTVRLHGRGDDFFGKITGWKWKIGSGEWSRTDSSDTAFIAPLIEGSLLCSLAVINDDGNKAVDEVRVFTSYPVRDIAANIHHTLFLKTDATLWASGYNYSGQLGDGSMEDRDSPVRIMDDVKSMCAGVDHTLILKTDGTLWGCGDNSSGQLGDGLILPHPYPVRIMSDVQSMAAGSWHTLILKTDQTLWACGNNESGQLGDGTTETRYLPVRIMSDVKNMAAGEAHSIFVKLDGTVLTCGSNGTGQLGIDSVLVPWRLVAQPITTDAQSVYAGLHYSMVLKNDKTLWGCGYNEYGQLGDATMEDRYSLVKVQSDVRTIVAGAGFSMTIKTDDVLWACGWNYYGNWGTGTWEDRYMPTKVTTDVRNAAASSNYGMILKTDGSVWIYGIKKKVIERVIPFMDSLETIGD